MISEKGRGMMPLIQRKYDLLLTLIPEEKTKKIEINNNFNKLFIPDFLLMSSQKSEPKIDSPFNTNEFQASESNLSRECSNQNKSNDFYSKNNQIQKVENSNHINQINQVPENFYSLSFSPFNQQSKPIVEQENMVVKNLMNSDNFIDNQELPRKQICLNKSSQETQVDNSFSIGFEQLQSYNQNKISATFTPTNSSQTFDSNLFSNCITPSNNYLSQPVFSGSLQALDSIHFENFNRSNIGVNKNKNILSYLQQTPKVESKERQYCFLGEIAIQSESNTSGQNHMKYGDEIVLQLEKQNVISQNNNSNNKKKKEVQQVLQKIQVRWQGKQIGWVSYPFNEILYQLLNYKYIIATASYIEGEKVLKPFQAIHLLVEIQLDESCFELNSNCKIMKASQILRDPSETKKTFAMLLSYLRIPLESGVNFELDWFQKNNQNCKVEKIKIPKEKIDIKSYLMKSKQQCISTKPQNKDFTEEDDIEEDLLDQQFEETRQLSDDSNYYDPPQSYKLKLDLYQKQMLAWMLQREGNLKDIHKFLEKENTLNLCWQKYALSLQQNSEQRYLYFNPFFGYLSSTCPKSYEYLQGGIVLDDPKKEMRSIIVALIHSNISGQQINYKSFKVYKTSGTLIITQNNQIDTWYNEIMRLSNEKTISFFADKREKAKDIDLSQFNIVITSYEKMQSLELNKLMLDYQWYRIVLDEVIDFQIHNYKNNFIFLISNQAHLIQSKMDAVHHLKGQNRWCITTPKFQQKTDEILKLLTFLQMQDIEICKPSQQLTSTNYNDYLEKYKKNVIKKKIEFVYLRRRKKEINQGGGNQQQNNQLTDLIQNV